MKPLPTRSKERAAADFQSNGKPGMKEWIEKPKTNKKEIRNKNRNQNRTKKNQTCRYERRSHTGCTVPLPFFQPSQKKKYIYLKKKQQQKNQGNEKKNEKKRKKRTTVVAAARPQSTRNPPATTTTTTTTTSTTTTEKKEIYSDIYTCTIVMST